MTTEKRAPQAEEERDLAGQEFDGFIQSVPADARIYVTLKRCPSYLHPHVTENEDLPPPAFQQNFEAMQNEIRARYGPGKYRLYVRFIDPKTRKHRFTWPTFLLAETPEEEEHRLQAQAAGAGVDPLEQARVSLGRAAMLRAQAAELEATEAAATWGRKPASAAPDPQADLVRALLPALIAALKPQDPIALARNLRELMAPAKGDGGIGGLAEGVAAIMDVAERMGGRRGAGGLWEVAIPHLAEVLKTWGPHLPAVARVLAGGAEEVRRARAAAGQEAPPAAPAAPGEPAAEPAAGPVAQAAGEDPRKQEALQTLLRMGYLGMTAPASAGPGEAREDEYATLGDFCLAHLPGLREDLLRMGPEQVWGTWSALDPRVLKLGEPARAWVEGFRAFLVLGPAEPEAPA